MKIDVFKILMTIALLLWVGAFGVVLTGCQGVTGTLATPYGDIHTDNGKTVVAPKPIVIPDK